MELNLQFGFGMMDHSRALIDGWKGGTVILSPRDLSPVQLKKLCESILRLNGGRVRLDPQFYVPRADHERLCSHAYWPQEFDTGVFWQGTQLQKLIVELRKVNTELNCSSFVLPGMLANPIDEDWFGSQEAIIEAAQAEEIGKPLVCTVALSDKSVQDIDQVSGLIERAEDWKVEEFYLVAEHPDGSYLVKDPSWLANLIDLAAGLRLLGKRVTIGYCTHQMLIAAAAKVTAIASGTWMNVRSFPPEKFVVPTDDEIKQRSKWYYCPQALSEYKIPYLDIAKRQGVLQSMAPPASLASPYADILFSGVQPTLAKAFSEQAAFRHYLQSLHSQSVASVRGTFQETVDWHRSALDTAASLLETLRRRGVTGQLRDFTDSVDANRTALQVLIDLRGASLSRAWNTL